MPGNRKQYRMFILLLSGVSLVIWGIIAHEVIRVTNPAPLPAAGRTPVAAPAAAAPPEPVWIGHIAGLRNPFIPGRVPGQRSPPPAAREEAPLPAVRYSGFLQDGSERIAVLETAPGLTRLCSTGDSLAGMTILRIEAQQLRVRFQKRERLLPLLP